MSEREKDFPDHIYDKTRFDLARTVLEKESRKLFLGLSTEAWRAMDQAIQGWLNDPVMYHLEDGGPRDFWDAFAAFIESIKLKPDFTAWVTGENVEWHRTSVPIHNTVLTSPLAQLKKIPMLDVQSGIPFARLIEALDQHPESMPEQKELIDQHSTDPVQDSYPIIARKRKDGLLSIIDGNRRTLKAVIYGRDEIDAWVGTIKDGEKPINFWVPLNDMFQLVEVYKDASDKDDEELKYAVATVLKARFAISAVAKRAFEIRIGNQNQTAKQLFDVAVAVDD